MNELIPTFESSLFSPTFDVLLDMAEIGIDSILAEGILSEIPIVKIVVGLAKTAQNVHDRNMLIQTLQFIKTFRNGTIDDDKLNKYKTELKQKPQKLENELGRVLILLNNTIEISKSAMLAKMYIAFINEKISWELFCDYTEIINHLFIIDISILNKICNREIKDTTQCNRYQPERLIAVGLLNSTIQDIYLDPNPSTLTEKYISTNEIGDLFCEIIFDRI